VDPTPANPVPYDCPNYNSTVIISTATDSSPPLTSNCIQKKIPEEIIWYTVYGTTVSTHLHEVLEGTGTLFMDGTGKDDDDNVKQPAKVNKQLGHSFESPLDCYMCPDPSHLASTTTYPIIIFLCPSAVLYSSFGCIK